MKDNFVVNDEKQVDFKVIMLFTTPRPAIHTWLSGILIYLSFSTHHEILNILFLLPCSNMIELWCWSMKPWKLQLLTINQPFNTYRYWNGIFITLRQEPCMNLDVSLAFIKRKYMMTTTGLHIHRQPNSQIEAGKRGVWEGDYSIWHVKNVYSLSHTRKPWRKVFHTGPR